MKQKITDAEALEAAKTLKKYCQQFTPQHSCYGCIFYWEWARMGQSSCRIDKCPVLYNLRSPQKQVKEAAK